jgi:predicted Zn-dependent protease
MVAGKAQEGMCLPTMTSIASMTMIGARGYFASVRLPCQVMAVLAAISLVSCGMSETLQRIWSVRAAVVRVAGTGGASVSVNLRNARYLAISVDNRAQAGRPDEERDVALTLAKAAYAAYDLRSTLEQVTVAFPSVHKAMFFVTVRRVAKEDIFQFRPSDLIETAGRDQPVSSPPERTSLHLLPIGDMPPDLMAQMVLRLQKRFPFPLSVLPALPVDPAAYNRNRQQAIADDLIANIEQRYAGLLHEPDARIIAVTPVDMYIRTENWGFTFSLRDDNDRVAVVSFARMSPEMFGNTPDQELLQSRLRKMVTKNIGIMCYGFPLSENHRSVLYGSIGGVDELDLMTEEFNPAD